MASEKKGPGLFSAINYIPNAKALCLTAEMPAWLLFSDRSDPRYKCVCYGQLVVRLLARPSVSWQLQPWPGWTELTGCVPGSPSTKLTWVTVPLVDGTGVILRLHTTEALDDTLEMTLTRLETSSSYYCPYDPGVNKVESDQTPRIGNYYQSYQNGLALMDQSTDGVVTYLSSSIGVVKAEPNEQGVTTLQAQVNLSPEDEVFVVLRFAESLQSLPVLNKTGMAEAFEKGFELVKRQAAITTLDCPDTGLCHNLQHANIGAFANWRPPGFLHSPCVWSDWFFGWRSLYGPIAVGMLEQAASTFKFFADHQEDKPKDPKMERLENTFLPGSRKVYGRIPMIISRTVDGFGAGGHHDVSGLYVDELYSYWCWTGDTELIKSLYPKLEKLMAWRKTARDPDDDGLYVNVLNTWVSDSHEYHQGPGTVESAYAWRNNMQMAEFGEALGQDVTFYRDEADRIAKAVNERLWVESKGVFAEYIDAIGLRHEVPEASAIYHPIELGLAQGERALQMLEWASTNLAGHDNLCLSNNWFPTGRCFHQEYANETLNMAYAAFVASYGDYGYTLLKAVSRAMDVDLRLQDRFIPHTFQCDPGDVYFMDTISLFQRCVVEGLWGLHPERQRVRFTWRPYLPHDWPEASLKHPLLECSWRRIQGKVEFFVCPTFTADWTIQSGQWSTSKRVKEGEEWRVLQDNVDLQCEAGRAMSKPTAEKEIAAAVPDLTGLGQSVGIDIAKHCNGIFNDLPRFIPPDLSYSLGIEADLARGDFFKVPWDEHGRIVAANQVQFQRYPAQDDACILLVGPKAELLFRQGYLRSIAEEIELPRYATKLESKVELPVARIHAKYVNFLIGVLFSPMQSYMDHLKITLTYADGATEGTMVQSPDDIDCFLQHTSKNYSIPLRTATQFSTKFVADVHVRYPLLPHLDVLTVEADPTKPLIALHCEVVTLETTVGIVAVTTSVVNR